MGSNKHRLIERGQLRNYYCYLQEACSVLEKMFKFSKQ